MRFEDIPGYSDAKKKLTSMFTNNRIGHAITFTGEEGSANLALSIAFAQYMSCENRSANDSCGNCPSCIKNRKFQHPDLHFYFPTTTSTKVPKNALSHKYYEQWREYLNEHMFVSHSSWLLAMDPNKKEAFISSDESLQIIKDLSLKSYEGANRFAIIWLPEKMNVSSSNKLLKIIEEPPENVYFFLVTENTEAVLPTIMSRTQTLRIGRMQEEDIVQWMSKEQPELGIEKIKTIANGANGNPLRAMKLADDDFSDSKMMEVFISWARLCYKAYEKMPDLIDYSEKLAGMSRQEQKNFLSFGLKFFRSALLVNNDVEKLFYSLIEDKKHIKNFAPLLNLENSSNLVKIFDMAFKRMERYANNKILFLDLSMHMARNINAKNVNL